MHHVTLAELEAFASLEPGPSDQEPRTLSDWAIAAPVTVLEFEVKSISQVFISQVYF